VSMRRMQKVLCRPCCDRERGWYGQGAGDEAEFGEEAGQAD
jgi:hypothetical protein